MITRRSVLCGLLGAPVVITTPGLLMPVRSFIVPPQEYWVSWYEQRETGQWVERILSPEDVTRRADGSFQIKMPFLISLPQEFRVWMMPAA